MSSLARRGRRGGYTAAATACATTGLVLLVLAFASGPQPPPEPPPTARSTHTQPHAQHRPPESETVALPPAQPVKITAKRIGLAVSVEAVGIAKDGSIAMPADAAHAGWYTG